MNLLDARKVVQRHPELREEMAKLFPTLEDIANFSEEEITNFYCDFVSMAVENNPTLLD